jgi:hypothetical protein
MSSYPWRVWFAFEVRPGITIGTGRDRSEHWTQLAKACRGADGKIDIVEFNHWLDILMEREHVWGNA